MYDPVSSVFQGIGALVGMDASRKAANQQADAAAAAAAGFDPYKTAGVNALSNLQSRVNAGPGEFTGSPGYQFRLQEGVNALDRSAAAKGKLLSGQQGKAITKFGQDYASGEYQNWLNQWYQSLTPYQNMVNTGLSAQGASVLPTMTVGQSQAAGTLGQANTFNSLMNTYGEGWQTNVAPMSPNNALSMFMGGGGQNMMNGMGGMGGGAGSGAGWWSSPAVAAVF